ncbi:MAG: fibronectin type III domain-containing protein [Solirubrobacteraceae bacterium]
MKRACKLAVLVVVLASISAVAWAGASPTVVTGPPAQVTDTTAVLTGRIDPNGHGTDFAFSYGPTTAYGVTTPARAVGPRKTFVVVKQAITGLTPGTAYHYRIGALNGSGSSVGSDRTFTTTGHPPAAVVTGAAVGVGRTVATPTGTVNPEDATTGFQIQYGLSTAYGYETNPQEIAASPSRDRRSPYRFTTSGSLSGAHSIPAQQRCAGNVGIRYYGGRRQVAFVVAPMGANCRFAATASFRRLRGSRPASLRITVDYRGTGYVAPGSSIDHVTAG